MPLKSIPLLHIWIFCPSSKIRIEVLQAASHCPPCFPLLSLPLKRKWRKKNIWHESLWHGCDTSLFCFYVLNMKSSVKGTVPLVMGSVSTQHQHDLTISDLATHPVFCLCWVTGKEGRFHVILFPMYLLEGGCIDILWFQTAFVLSLILPFLLLRISFMLQLQFKQKIKRPFISNRVCAYYSMYVISVLL